MSKLAKAGAVAFGLWGVLHVAGGGAILVATISGGAERGFAFYGHGGASLPAATGGVLAYFAYLLVLAGLAAAAVALRLNWRNSELGLALNTGLILAIELGLILFLLIPGHLALAEAWPGFLLFALGATFGGIACREVHPDVAA